MLDGRLALVGGQQQAQEPVVQVPGIPGGGGAIWATGRVFRPAGPWRPSPGPVPDDALHIIG